MSNLSYSNKIKHVAIIMDGNGRWAQERAHRRLWGHVRGSRNVSAIVEKANQLELKALTLYAFSTENWSRPLSEVQALFKIMKKFLLQERDKILKSSIRFRVIGDISSLPDDTKILVRELEEKTKQATGLKLSLAFSYGSRSELLNAANLFIRENPGRILTERDLENNLFTTDSGDVDLLIRTGGDFRISNFLLWQSAYAELFFTETRWPEFSPDEFETILKKVSERERRFGSTGNVDSFEESKEIAKKQQQNISRS